ncbi:hypothetical protein BKA67DRAFT_571092 [Truncatella angustata]|uniref:Uncharacterized protein n=1 Tax=Truncatella angustata TaxID=152316 RepID=A0A9P8ZUV5_9PEZI|nr:uncharacterized protein BKA67DRAFT_571092 [Truncatella angustata]KAH6651496.1 hypothetical protein BKA67DRAFT_571092 [Truncatella angustata]
MHRNWQEHITDIDLDSVQDFSHKSRRQIRTRLNPRILIDANIHFHIDSFDSVRPPSRLLTEKLSRGNEDIARQHERT